MPGLGLSSITATTTTTTASPKTPVVKRAKSTDLQLLPPPPSREGGGGGGWETNVPQISKYISPNNNINNTTGSTYYQSHHYNPSATAFPATANNNVGNSSSNGNGGFDSEKPKLDPSDPRVKKLVYSMYRDMLTNYNGEANDMIRKQDPRKVSQDSGVQPILESIVMRQRSAQGGSGDLSGSIAEANAAEVGQGEGEENGSGSSNGNHSEMPPPPPPPPMLPGAIPAVRLRSEIGTRDTGPPAALASAMMKDKKPFTYTPGGIDLSEIRSPRMAKRIQMNAAAEGVCNTPQPSSNNQQERPPAHLPPAALAAMQPQMAIPVFPQGNNNVQLNKSHKPADYTSQPPPPPPQPSFVAPSIRPQNTTTPQSPLAQLQQPQQMQSLSPVSSPVPKSPTPARTPPPPPERAATPHSPVPTSDSNLASPRPQDERRSPLGRKSPAMVEQQASGVGTGSLFIPPVQQQSQQSPPTASSASSPSPLSTYVPPSARAKSPMQAKAQAVSQSIGSLYIPPIGGNQMESPAQMSANGNPPMAPPQPQNIIRTPQYAQQQTPPQTQSTPFTPSTPQLNRAPVPWMNSYNRLQNQQAESPPYVHPGFFMPPWGPPPGAPMPRTIPIMRESDQADGSFPVGNADSRRSSSASGGSTPSGSRTPSQAATHLGRVIPIQIEREEAAKAKGAKIIPIQIEGRPPRAQTPSTPMTPLMNPMRRAVGPAPYNSPMGLYSNQNAADAYQRQAAAELAGGMDKMNIRCESPRMEPMQSKSLRVIQQAAENELKRLEQEQLQRRMDLSEDDRHLMNLFKSQVDEGSSLHQTAEPRFMGSHIPSKAFRMLQTTLPAGPGAQDQQPQSFPTAHNQPVTHHIPIRQVAQSPTPQQHSQAQEIHIQHGGSNVPPSEQKVQEPKKYMGSNIPSRSFKILQQMTADDGQPVVGSCETAFSSEEQNIGDLYTDDDSTTSLSENPEGCYLNSTYSSFPLSPSCSSEGGGSAHYDPYNNNNDIYNSDGIKGNGNDDSCQNNSSCWPADAADQGWDPYSYMWYYWWYYSYWGGYDMTGYEYPPGWDPNYPYCPPEFFSTTATDPSSSEYATATSEAFGGEDESYYNYHQHHNYFNLENRVANSSSQEDSRKSLGAQNDDDHDYDKNNDKCRMDFNEGFAAPPPNPLHQSSSTSIVPRIVIEDGEKIEGKGGERIDSLGSIKDNNNSFSRSSNNNHNNDDNNNEGRSSSSKVPSSVHPWTECNEKPGNPTTTTTLPCKRMNDCDSSSGSVSEIRRKDVENFSECGRQQQSINLKNNDNDSVEKMEEVEENSSQSSSDDEYESCCEDPDQKVIERETGPFNNKPASTFLRTATTTDETKASHDNYNGELNEKEDLANEECSDDEKTDPGTDEDNDYGGKLAIIEEPETPSSADDSDVAPLMNEHQQQHHHQRSGKSSFYHNGDGLTIEEYHSEESSADSTSTVFDYGPRKSRLSTIDEITESRASSSSFLSSSKNLAGEFDRCCSSGVSRNQNSRGENMKKSGAVGGGSEDKEENSESEESSEDELSSVSVIENKSDATRGTESKREDETTSTSGDEDSSSSSSSAEDDEKEEDDDEEAEGNDTAVTVRLPLKLCFTKTKSYKDITTVMVGDSEIEEATTSAISQFSSSPTSNCAESETTMTIAPTQENGNGNNDRFSDKGITVEETLVEDEPVVSFTLSLSRQTSREDEQKKREAEEGYNEKVESSPCAGNNDEMTTTAADDIDFWAQISGTDSVDGGASSEGGNTRSITEEKGKEVEKSNQGNKEDYERKQEDCGGESFWGVITRDRSASDFPRRNSRQKAWGAVDTDDDDHHHERNRNSLVEGDEPDHQWDPNESIDYKWEKDFNFWEKSSRTIETRRFSDFEITEDYESDSGIKPSCPGRKERVKKYTHHKRHSIPGPTWDRDRSSLPPRIPNANKQLKDSSKPNKSSSNNEQDIKHDGKVCENEKENTPSVAAATTTTVVSGGRQAVDCQDADTSSWWSYWDEVTRKNEEEKFENNNDETTTGREKASLEEAGVHSRKTETDSMICAAEEGYSEGREECSTDISVEIKLSGNERYSTGESTQGEDDYQSFACNQQQQQAVSHMVVEQEEHCGIPSSLSERVENVKSLNHSCQSDATTVTTDSENYSSSPEIKSSLLFPHEGDKLIQQQQQQHQGSASISDENSDESSSRSSGTTIGRTDKSEIKKEMLTSMHSSSTPAAVTAETTPSSLDNINGDCGENKAEEEKAEDDGQDTSIQIPLAIERNVEIKHEMGERNKLKHQEEQHYHHHHHHHHLHATATSAINSTSSTTATTTSTTTCTCLGDRIARAESLLWRIERFLHESLSLGSEDDSGVMTDLSRQISDVDTDVDNDLNETEFLLTAAAAAKERRGMAPNNNTIDSTKESESRHEHIESCNFGETISSTDGPANPCQDKTKTSTNNSNSSAGKKPRPKSDIFLESTLLSKVDVEESTTTTTTTSSATTEEGTGVKMRSASERRALRYQRAKTHSRLFQLLQDECGRDEDLDEFDYESDVGGGGTNTTNNNVVDCQISVDTSEVTVASAHHHHQHHRNNGMEDDCHNASNTTTTSTTTATSTSPTRMNDAQARRSRLLPLPLKNLLASSVSLDSNSSPSGSSGVLSPTSPVNRDQLLADIINEFHLRNQASTMRAQSQRRMSTSFPSKVFKLLQHEFGEEFYQTFDCCTEDTLISPSMSTNLCANDSSSSLISSGGGGGGCAPIVHECTIHKSESMKEFEEATNRMLTNFMLRNAKPKSATTTTTATTETSCCTAISSKLLQEDSKSNPDFLEVPLRRKKGNPSRDLRSPKSTK